MDISTSSILAQLRGYTVSAVISTTLQLGLYWKLEEYTWKETDIADHYSIPIHRVQALINLLIHLGLLEKDSQDIIKPSDAMLHALEVYSQDTWEWIAYEGQKFLGGMANLTSNIGFDGNVWEQMKFEPVGYESKIGESADYARRFSLGLADMHTEGVAEMVDHLMIRGDETILDLGGGVGLLSGTLVSEYPGVKCTVIDQANVCELGRAYCKEQGWKVEFVAKNFVEEPLPSDIDIIIMSDVGPWTAEMFGKIRESLAENGRFIICTNYDGWGAWIDHETAEPDLQRRIGNLLFSLRQMESRDVHVDDIKQRLADAGFGQFGYQVLRNGILIIEARA